MVADLVSRLLRLDYDAKMRVPSIGEVTWLLARAGYVPVVMWQARSPSGKGWHVQIRVDPEPVSCLEVAALQCVLGSDPKREACNIQRAYMVDHNLVPAYWAERWNVLYGEDHRRSGKCEPGSGERQERDGRADPRRAARSRAGR